jgi:hypothetical protein
MLIIEKASSLTSSSHRLSRLDSTTPAKRRQASPTGEESYQSRSIPVWDSRGHSPGYGSTHVTPRAGNHHLHVDEGDQGLAGVTSVIEPDLVFELEPPTITELECAI